MFALLAQVARYLTLHTADGATEPHRLMESAEARAGRDSHQAQELRQAACAALRVVR